MTKTNIYWGLWAVLAGAFLVLLFVAWQTKESPVEVIVNSESEPYQATLAGEYVCLPHKDTTGPQTEECAFGIKTETGEYYAIDFNLMSQTHQSPMVGEKLSASGVVTPIERLSSDHWQKYNVTGIFSVTSNLEVGGEAEGGVYACQADARICPDGSSVGRQGPKCEFTACPPVNATSSIVTTYLGGTVTGLNISVSPQEVVSDSRCPEGVNCIWAGTVEVRTILSTPVGQGEHVMTLGKPQVFGDYNVTLIEVTPTKTEEGIPDSSYRFTYEIERID